MASEQTTQSRAKLTAPVTELRCVRRLHSLDNNSSSFSFVLHEVLQLKERPVANPIVHFSSSLLFSYAFEVFHHNLVPVERRDNLFTDVVVNPSHVTSFSARDFPEKSFACTSAFGLQFLPDKLESSLCLLDLAGIEEPAIRSDCEVVYSEVDAENSGLQTRACSIDLFGKHEEKERSVLPVNSEQTLTNFPASEVLSISLRDVKLDLLPIVERPETELVPTESCASRKIVSNTTPADYWFCLGFLDYSTGLLDAGHCYLRWKQEVFSQLIIDEWMQFDIVLDFVLPSNINTVLDCSRVSSYSSDYFCGCRNPYLSCSSCLHGTERLHIVFKDFGGSVDSSPQQDCGVSSTHEL